MSTSARAMSSRAAAASPRFSSRSPSSRASVRSISKQLLPRASRPCRPASRSARAPRSSSRAGARPRGAWAALACDLGARAGRSAAAARRSARRARAAGRRRARAGRRSELRRAGRRAPPAPPPGRARRARLLGLEPPDVEGERRGGSASSCASCSSVWVASRCATICPAATRSPGATRSRFEDAALEVLDGLALALGQQHAVGDDGAVEPGVHAPAADAWRQSEAIDRQRDQEDRAR